MACMAGIKGERGGGRELKGISGGSRPSDTEGAGGGGHPDPEIRGGPLV